MKVKGKYLRTRVDGKTIALATSCSLNATTQFTDARTKDDAEGPVNEPDYIDWTISSENMVGANDGVTNEEVYTGLMDLMLAKQKVYVIVELVADGSGAIPQGGWQSDPSENRAFSPYGGFAYIESVNLTAPNEGNATISVNFKGAGPLEKVKKTS